MKTITLTSEDANGLRIYAASKVESCLMIISRIKTGEPVGGTDLKSLPVWEHHLAFWSAILKGANEADEVPSELHRGEVSPTSASS